MASSRVGMEAAVGLGRGVGKGGGVGAESAAKEKVGVNRFTITMVIVSIYVRSRWSVFEFIF